MGLDFKKPASQTLQAVPETKNEIEVVEQYDIVADRQEMILPVQLKSIIWKRLFLLGQK